MVNRCRILEYISDEALQSLQDAYARVADVALSLVSPDYIYLTAPSNHLKICENGFKKSAEGAKTCMYNFQSSTMKLTASKPFNLFDCEFGLSDFSSVVRDKSGQPLAFIHGGQVVLSPEQRGRIINKVNMLIPGVDMDVLAKQVRLKTPSLFDFIVGAANKIFSIAIAMAEETGVRFDIEYNNLLSFIKRFAAETLEGQECCYYTYENDLKSYVLFPCRQHGVCDSPLPVLPLDFVKNGYKTYKIDEIGKVGDLWNKCSKIKNTNFLTLLPLVTDEIPRGALVIFQEKDPAQNLDEKKDIIARFCGLLIGKPKTTLNLYNTAKRFKLLLEIASQETDKQHNEDLLEEFGIGLTTIMPRTLIRIWRYDQFYKKFINSGTYGDVSVIDIKEFEGLYESRINNETINKILSGDISEIVNYIAEFDEKKWDDISECPVKSYVSVPIADKDQVIGVVNLYSTERYYFTQRDITFLHQLAKQVKETMIRSASMRFDNARKIINTAQKNSHTFSEFIHRVANDSLPKIFHCYACTIFLVDESNQYLIPEIVFTGGKEIEINENEEDNRYKKGEGITGTVWAKKRSIRIPFDIENNVTDFKKFWPSIENKGRLPEQLPKNRERQYLAAPILHNGRVFGVVRFCGEINNKRFMLEDEELFNLVCNEIGQYMHYFKTIDEKNRNLGNLVLIGETIHEVMDNDMALSFIAAGIIARDSLAFDRVGIWTIDHSDKLNLTVAMEIPQPIDKKDITTVVKKYSLHNLIKKIRDRSLEIRGNLYGTYSIAKMEIKEEYLTAEDNKEYDLITTIFRKKRPAQFNRRCTVTNNSPKNDIELFEHIMASPAVVIPVFGGGHPVGMIYCDRNKSNRKISEYDMKLLSEYGRQAGATIFNIQIRRREELTNAIKHAADRIISRDEKNLDFTIPSFDEIFKEIKKQKYAISKGLLLYIDPEKKRLVHIGNYGLKEDMVEKVNRLCANKQINFFGNIFKCLENKELPFYLKARFNEDIPKEWRTIFDEDGGLLVVPIGLKDHLLGIMLIHGENVIERDFAYFVHSLNHIAFTLVNFAKNRAIYCTHKIIDLVAKIAIHNNLLLSGIEKDIADSFYADACYIFLKNETEDLLYIHHYCMKNENPYQGKKIIKITDDINLPEIIENLKFNHTLSCDTISKYAEFFPVFPDIDDVFSSIAVNLNNPNVTGGIILIRSRVCSLDTLSYDISDLKLLETIATTIMAVENQKKGVYDVALYL